jgi:hypothetical protein
MAHSAHDVGLLSFVINGVAHGLAVNSNALVLGAKATFHFCSAPSSTAGSTRTTAFVADMRRDVQWGVVRC